MKINCAFCGKEFKKRNGSSRYCPGKTCYNAAKNDRQKEVDDLLKSFRRGFYQNYKIFKSILPSPGTIRKPLNDIIQLGFDDHAFYKAFTDKNKLVWRYVGNYLFSILQEQGTYQIIIYKK
jgi:hypothetical protein